MDETLFQHFWVIGVFLGRKTNKTLFEEENFEWLKTCHNHVNTKVILKPINQVGI